VEGGRRGAPKKTKKHEIWSEQTTKQKQKQKKKHSLDRAKQVNLIFLSTRLGSETRSISTR
jgi:hypothetical protein